MDSTDFYNNAISDSHPSSYNSSGSDLMPKSNFESTISVGDYDMPRAGSTSQYKVKGKDK